MRAETKLQLSLLAALLDWSNRAECWQWDACRIARWVFTNQIHVSTQPPSPRYSSFLTLVVSFLQDLGDATSKIDSPKMDMDSILREICAGPALYHRLILCVHALQLPELEVWFQRATDVVRKLLRGDVDIGIVGNDMYQEIADRSEDLIVVHEALDFGQCHLGLGIPTLGKFANINSLADLRR